MSSSNGNQPPLGVWRIPILTEADGQFVYWFEAHADNEEHALEQAEDALTDGEVAGGALRLS